MYAIRDIGVSEELTFDYNSVTESEEVHALSGRTTTPQAEAVMFCAGCCVHHHCAGIYLLTRTGPMCVLDTVCRGAPYRNIEPLCVSVGPAAVAARFWR
jgi:hypothetical protein